MENKIFEKKTDYNFESHNFAIDGELTVTITLCEYRELVASKATKEAAIRKAEEDKWKRNDENSKLREENAALKAELYELKKRIDAFGEEETAEQVEEGGDY